MVCSAHQPTALEWQESLPLDFHNLPETAIITQPLEESQNRGIQLLIGRLSTWTPLDVSMRSIKFPRCRFPDHISAY